MRVDSIPRRDRWQLYLLFPRFALRYLWMRFRLGCPLPGETFVSLTRDLRARCLGVSGDQVLLELRSGMYLQVHGCDWDSLPPGAIRDITAVERRDFARSDWQPG